MSVTGISNTQFMNVTFSRRTGFVVNTILEFMNLESFTSPPSSVILNPVKVSSLRRVFEAFTPTNVDGRLDDIDALAKFRNCNTVGQ